MKKLALVGVAVAMMSASGAALADKKAFEAIEYRQAIFKAVKWQFGPMGDMVRGKQAFDGKEFAQRAQNLAALSQMPLEGFIEDTYASKTAALPKIEKEWDKFSAGMETFSTNAAKLAEVAKTEDLAKIRPAFGEVAKTCKACHDAYKD